MKVNARLPFLFIIKKPNLVFIFCQFPTTKTDLVAGSSSVVNVKPEWHIETIRLKGFRATHNFVPRIGTSNPPLSP